MNDDKLLEEISRIRMLLELMAEPAVAQRDAKLREELRKIVGSSPKKERSVFLMDGSLTQAQICAKSTLDRGDLSKLVGKLESATLITDGRKQPKLAISIPSNFFETNAKNN